MYKKSKQNQYRTKCPSCGGHKLIKYGKDKGVQKYKCSSCGRISRDKNYNLEINNKNNRLILSALLRLINIDFGSTCNEYLDVNLQDILNPTLIDADELKKITFRVNSLDRLDAYGNDPKDNGTKNINCYNPRVVLCKNGNTIEIIKLPKFENREILHKINSYTYKRTICLVNSYRYRKIKVRHQIH